MEVSLLRQVFLVRQAFLARQVFHRWLLLEVTFLHWASPIQLCQLLSELLRLF